MQKARVLVVEDDPHMMNGLMATLNKEGHELKGARDVSEAMEELARNTYHLVLTDLKLPGGSGMQVLEEVKRRSELTPVIVITAYGTVEKAVEAMKAGAVDFIQKPFSPEELRAAVRRSLNGRDMFGETDSCDQACGIITKDQAMYRILQRARAVASTRVPVLIQGESGTGKELLARFIHALSPRKERAFVAVNCAAIPENLLESELFGHEKGAFTGAMARKLGKFEQANGGTLLLDEIGEMSLNLQAKLLRVLQEWEVDRVGGTSPVKVDVRLLATTNADLAECVRKGKFREDLYFRLSVIPFQLPPLRQRPGDIPLLAEHFLKCAAREHGRQVLGLEPRALDKLQRHTWRGNIRELRNVMERAVLLCQGKLVRDEDIFLERLQEAHLPEEQVNGSLKDVERELILCTLEKEGWNRTRASAKLGISIRTLRNKLHEYRREGFLQSEAQGRCP
ncbi:MAG: sigma-54 dependent transcriptional regulator [bacterium]